MAKDAGGASGGLKKATTTAPITPRALPPDERAAKGGLISGATISPPKQTRLGGKAVPPPAKPVAPVVPVAPPTLTWSPLFGLRYGSQQARIGTYGPEVSVGGQWQQMADYLANSTQSARNAAHSEALLGGTYPEDTSWREYLADPTKPEEAAPSLVEQSRIMGAISRAINGLDTGGTAAEDYGYLFDDSGYGWGDGWGGGGGYSQYGYGPDSMLYQWRIGL